MGFSVQKEGSSSRNRRADEVTRDEFAMRNGLREMLGLFNSGRKAFIPSYFICHQYESVSQSIVPPRSLFWTVTQPCPKFVHELDQPTRLSIEQPPTLTLPSQVPRAETAIMLL